MIRRDYIYVFFIYLCVAMSVYFPAFGGGWYFDDFNNIVLNEKLPLLKNNLLNMLSPRSVSHLSFSIDYQLFGYNPELFRCVNIFIHNLNAFLVYLFFMVLDSKNRLFALFAGFVFLIHPVQTQPVSYVVQRMTLLAFFFLLLSLLSFVFYMKNKESSRAIIYFVSSVVLGLLSVSSKENTAVLPIIVFSYLFYVDSFGLSVKKRLLIVAPFFLVPCYGVLLHLTYNGFYSGVSTVPFFGDVVQSTGLYSVGFDPENLRGRFILAQFQVFWIYLKLLVFPVGQALDYSWPLPVKFSGWDMFLSAVLLFVSAIYAFLVRKKRPVVFFAILWIFLSMIVESGPIPLDPIFEHRLYMPLIGILLLSKELLTKLFTKLLPKKAQVLLIVIVVVSLTSLSVQRNIAWGNPVALWESNVKEVPRSPRALYWLAYEYLRAGRYLDAANVLEKLLNVGGLGPVKIWLAEAWFNDGDERRAFELFKEVASSDPEDNSLSLYQGVGAFRQGDFTEARMKLGIAKRKDRNDPRVYYYWGLLDEADGQLFAAAKKLQNAVKKARGATGIGNAHPLIIEEMARTARLRVITSLQGNLREKQQEFVLSKDFETRLTFTNTLQMMGLFDQALENYKALMEQSPNIWFLPYNAGLSAQKLEKFSQAEKYYIESFRLNPKTAVIPNNLGDLYLVLKQAEKAREYLEIAVNLDPGYGEAQFNLAKAYYSLGDKQRAREHFTMIKGAFPALRVSAEKFLTEL